VRSLLVVQFDTQVVVALRFRSAWLSDAVGGGDELAAPTA